MILYFFVLVKRFQRKFLYFFVWFFLVCTIQICYTQPIKKKTGDVKLWHRRKNPPFSTSAWIHAEIFRATTRIQRITGWCPYRTVWKRSPQSKRKLSECTGWYFWCLSACTGCPRYRQLCRTYAYLIYVRRPLRTSYWWDWWRTLPPAGQIQRNHLPFYIWYVPCMAGTSWKAKIRRNHSWRIWPMAV